MKAVESQAVRQAKRSSACSTWRARVLRAAGIAACASALLFSGCVQLDFSSAADPDENSKMQIRDVTSAYWWDWGKSAQSMLDDRLQDADGRVDERAIQRLIVSQKWWEVLSTCGTLGIVKPVELTVWLEEAR